MYIDSEKYLHISYSAHSETMARRREVWVFYGVLYSPFRNPLLSVCMKVSNPCIRGSLVEVGSSQTCPHVDGSTGHDFLSSVCQAHPHPHSMTLGWHDNHCPQRPRRKLVLSAWVFWHVWCRNLTWHPRHPLPLILQTDKTDALDAKAFPYWDVIYYLRNQRQPLSYFSSSLNPTHFTHLILSQFDSWCSWCINLICWV